MRVMEAIDRFINRQSSHIGYLSLEKLRPGLQIQAYLVQQKPYGCHGNLQDLRMTCHRKSMGQ